MNNSKVGGHTMKSFVKSYFNRMQETIAKIDPENIVEIIDALEACHDRSGKIYVIGNGGSAATSSHMANDLAVGLKLRKIRNFDVESLSDNVSVCTAIANDTGYENIFYTQLHQRIREKDVLIAISCSGDSPNIVKAVKYANQVGSKVIGLTGFDGGFLKDNCSAGLHVETDKGEYGIVEDIHMMLDHVIFSYYLSLKQESFLAEVV
jgi:D-sedoheptulose 7-phosphate isomerase